MAVLLFGTKGVVPAAAKYAKKTEAAMGIARDIGEGGTNAALSHNPNLNFLIILLEKLLSYEKNKHPAIKKTN